MKPPSMSRRKALLGAGSVAITATAPWQHAQANSGKAALIPEKPSITGKALLNRPRAQEMLERFDLAGLVAADPINVYYLTNVETIGVGFRQQHPGYATLGRDMDVPPHLIATIVAAYDIADEDRETAQIITHGNNWPDQLETDENGIAQDPAVAAVSAITY